MSRGHGVTQRWVLDQLTEGPYVIRNLAYVYLRDKSEASGRLAGNYESSLRSIRRAISALENEGLVEVRWVDPAKLADPDYSVPVKAVQRLY